MLSVILCVNKTNPHLKNALTSVLCQSHRDFELLIAANGCDDSLINELEELTKGDARVTIYRLELAQLSFSLNFLVNQAKSDWIVRMDGDDICEPNRLGRLEEVIKTNRYDVVGSWATLIDEYGNQIGTAKPQVSQTAIRRHFLLKCQFIHPSVAFRKSFWLEMRGYLGGFVSEDFDLWLRALNKGARFHNIPEYLLRYRIHHAQVSRSRLGYAETASHWYRELLNEPSLYKFTGWIIATFKCFFMPLKNRISLRSDRPKSMQQGVRPDPKVAQSSS